MEDVRIAVFVSGTPKHVNTKPSHISKYPAMANDKKTLKERVKEKINSGNPGTFGDPTSLKAESSDRIPTEEEKGAEKRETKKQEQQPNPSMLGDHTSMEAEKLDSNDEKQKNTKKRDSKI